MGDRMGMQPDAEVEAESWYVSTGHLPSPVQIQHWVDEAHERYRSIADGENAQVYPALARAPSDLFAICAVGTSGNVYTAGDAGHEFAIMSVAKPFVFALVCQSVGAAEARRRLGVNATGLPFNSYAAVERSADGRTNPMVNAGAIATASLTPGDTVEAKWRDAGRRRRRLPLRARRDNHRGHV
jgi:glutaminase